MCMYRFIVRSFQNHENVESVCKVIERVVQLLLQILCLEVAITN